MLPVTYDREIISLSKSLQYGCIEIDVRNCVTFQHSRARRLALALTSCTTHVRTWKKKKIDKNKNDEKKNEARNDQRVNKESLKNGAIAYAEIT